jgi:hypothetical protein
MCRSGKVAKAERTLQPSRAGVLVKAAIIRLATAQISRDANFDPEHLENIKGPIH